MSSPTVHPDCPRTDAVLAIYLDGGVAEAGDENGNENGYEFVCGETLRNHLLGCPRCQLQLQRARRLDAALAADAGRSISRSDFEVLGAGWIAAALAAQPATRARPAVPAVPRLPLLARSSTLVLLAALFACSLLLLADRDAGGPSAVGTGAVGTGAAGDGAPGQGAAAPAPRGATNDAAAAAQVEPVRTETLRPAPAEILIAGDALRRRAEPRKAPPAAVDVGACVRQLESGHAGARRDAARELLAACGPFAPAGEQAGAALTGSLAKLGDRNASDRIVHPYLLDLAGANAHYARQLQAQLQRLAGRAAADRDDLAVLTVAARLGSRTLDAAILRAVRRQPALAEPLAAALRCGVRGDGGARLLLDVWQDLAARGALGDDEFSPARWFADQPAAVFDEVEHELRSARSAARRVHCLLALGFAASTPALDVLLAHISKGAHEEALAAAFALSHMPRHLLAPLAASAARSQDAFLLRAALARAALPEASPWIEALGLSDAEHLLLRAGPFAAFPRVVAWFRGLPTAASD